MTAIESIPSPAILKNRGVPVWVHKVSTDDGVRYNREYTDTDEPVKEKVWVKLTSLAQSEIEQRYGGRVGPTLDEDGDAVLGEDGQPVIGPLTAIEGWQGELAANPNTALIDTLAIIWEVDHQQAGKMMLDDGSDDYSNAIGAAFLMANNVEGDAVVRHLRGGVKEIQELKKTLAEVGLREVIRLEEEAEQRRVKIEEAVAADAAKDQDTQTNPSPSNPGQPDSQDGHNSADQLQSSGV